MLFGGDVMMVVVGGGGSSNILFAGDNFLMEVVEGSTEEGPEVLALLGMYFSSINAIVSAL